MEIFIPSSGYNFAWTWGVLSELSKSDRFIPKISRISTTGTSALAVIYANTVDSDVNQNLEHVAVWWSNQYTPMSYKRLIREVAHHGTGHVNLNLCNKMYKVGVSTFKGFKWKYIDPLNPATYISAVRSAYIPLVTVNPSLKLMGSCHGDILFDGNKHIRSVHDTVCINPSKRKRGYGMEEISMNIGGRRILRRLTTSEFIDQFHAGAMEARYFLMNNTSDVVTDILNRIFSSNKKTNGETSGK